ncbi:MAG: hypothetical protein EXS42_00585 [Lacunisphaera sp.]|nr:hypothetical protein [Lacunisphaera sp.]
MLLSLGPLTASAEKADSGRRPSSSFNGNWRREDNGSTVTISVTGTFVTLIYTPGTPDQGTVEGNQVTYRSTSGIEIRTPNGEVKTVRAVDVGTITLSPDGNAIVKQRVLSVPRMGDRSSTQTYYRVK